MGEETKKIYYNTTFPTEKEYNKYAENFPTDRLIKIIDGTKTGKISLNPFDITQLRESELINDIDTWLDNIKTLIFDLKFTYGNLRFYHDMGIPDNPHYISPGSEGQSIQFFPLFEAQHWYNQKSFRYYAEIFISKTFSILDNYGTLLLVSFAGFKPTIEQQNRKHFHTIVDSLKINDNELVNILKSIISEGNFLKVKQIRNDILHNRTPLKLRSQISVFESSKGGISVGPNITYLNADEVLDLVKYLINDVLIKVSITLFGEEDQRKENVD
ncbi:Cthe_2314 family HEPN domain-containing protein [Leptospira kanakyensis]|uniref:Cthe_2314 family HEPN domain-containing protein n=1 Tax=Leptospira kanakyensis TaxID=2484968 RepID=UPI00223E3F4E|nr:Cthe_2314 family HEPN domain-containing protein [Leptospira kanakyensis]MCW7483256.1 Cthe_2314 family HEPN domain-containing protein [Leptospira kanakyensis]